GSSADPSVEEMFGFNSYGGGAAVLHALRLTMGDDTFFELLRRWVAENNGESRTTEDFVALAEKVAGRSLNEFFDTWLYADEPPSEFPQPAS
ncbi:MAG: M1 family aminopeptidase, partial [Ilumatobacteraceae bacterium]